MNPYDAPNEQQRTNIRRIRFSLAITFFILFGIAALLALGIWARGQVRRMDRSSNLRQLRIGIEAYENKLNRVEPKPSDEATQDRQ